MSTQPTPINRQELARKLDAERTRAAKRYDVLYVIGGVLVTTGLGLFRIQFGLLAAGVFCLVFPMLNIITGFIRGLRTRR